jgi:hypothetical protein
MNFDDGFIIVEIPYEYNEKNGIKVEEKKEIVSDAALLFIRYE